MNNQPLEKTIVERIVKALKGNGVGWLLKTHGGQYQSSGIPDILCIAPRIGRLVGIEVKRPIVGRLTALQESQLKKIELAGGVAGVAVDVEGALALLQRANEVNDEQHSQRVL